MSDNIKVVVKVRPLITRELEDKLPYHWRVHNNTLQQLDINGRDSGQTFTFDKVYNEATKTTDVYKDVAQPIVEAATAGINGTIFAYGQTSSGKTYTMTGTPESPGIIPLSVVNLFNIIKNIPDRDFLVRVSYIEIYNETLIDLLDVKNKTLKIKETYEGIKVDAFEKVTSSPEDVLDVMREGEANRQTGATAMNEKSSRSHSIFQITIESREHIEGEDEAGCVNVSQLNLVDLAGSERAGQTGAKGIRFKEGTHINKSLSALALVIKQLSEFQNKFANYRDSKLTRILQNSLGGNAKTSIICAITPAALEETISTLQFATRAKAIKNKPEVNAVATDATMIQSLTKQLSRLQSQLESKKNLEVMLETKINAEQDLQKQIASLQKVILNSFVQRRNIEQLGGTRRKLQPPRRITISTLHSIEDDPVPTIPKFCTPSLKYNPMSIPNPSDFLPISNTNKLATLPEEPARLITPPPTEKKVNFENEVIEIDSDDDNKSTNCSPYHKCYYSTSKTPPCILREKLNRAEKEYKGILEFTEMEKLYKPDVVELMKKLQESTNMAAEFQEELEILKKNSKEKELEIDHLKIKIKKSEEEVSKSKLELETYCKEFNTKVTDWEVSYETLKKKAKLREEELLSLLAEQEKKAKKCEDIGKLPAEPPDKIPISLMNMSGDISLVNSDNESSIITPSEEESSEHIKDLVASLQDQLIEKCQTIVQLEANLASQKHSIKFLEESSNELQGLVDSLREKVVYTENENGLLQSTVSTLNATIVDLQKNLELAQNDMASYNTVIQELQTKLTKKDNLLNMDISDSVLETMIANEEKVIANNENMKNIIHSFKTALDSRNKEIEQLRLSTQEWNDSQIRTIIEDRDYKTKQVDILNEEMAKLTNQAKENINTINNLMREKSNLANVEQDLTKKIALIEVQKSELEELNKDSNLRIDKLKETNEELLYSLSETKLKEEEYVKLINELKDKIDNNTSHIIQIQEEIITKDNLISTLRKENGAKEEYEHQAKLSIDKIKSIISTLSGDVLEIPELLNNFVTLFNALSTGLSTLELVAMDTMSEKNTVLEENKRLKSDISDIHSKYDMESTTLKGEIEKIRKSLEINLTESAKLLETNDKLSEDISKHEKEIKIKRNEYEDLLSQYISRKDAETNLRDELLHKNEMISAFNEKEATYKIKISDLESKLNEIKLTLKSEHDQLKIKDETLAKASNTIEELKDQLKHKFVEVTMAKQKATYLAQENVQLMQNICRKLSEMLNNFNISNDFACNDKIRYSYEHVLLILDKISCEFKSIGIKRDDIENQLCESKKQADSLYDDNEKLRVKLSKIENENKALLAEIEKQHWDDQQINKNLVISNELLEHLKQDLKCKASEIEGITKTAQQWKDEFIKLDILMKQQMQNLQHENEQLHTRYQKLKNETQLQIDILSKETCDLDAPMTTVSNVKNNVDTSTPPSLLTICCNKIVEVIEPKSNDHTSVTKCGSNSEKHNIANINSCDTCVQLSLELRIIQEEKSSLSNIAEQLEKANENLIAEQDKVRQEVKFLVEQAQELQKKIASHKTNLSILTATTYAENRSLKSQVKGLQHHHSRFHNVCQRDIPEFKRQLHELLMILKGDPTISEIQNINQKRYSLPDVLDSNSTVCNFKNESVLDGDVLMLDTNVTITTTGDNTLVGYDHTCLDLTQTDLFNDVSCPINDPNQAIDELLNQESDRQNMLLQLEVLKKQNLNLKASIDMFSEVEQSKIDAQCSPIKKANLNENVQCVNCQIQVEKPKDLDTREEIKDVTQKLTDLQYEKDNIEQKYNNLVLEMPDIDVLVSKLNVLEKEYDVKVIEVSKLTSLLDVKNKELKTYQEENDSLSTQVMENISEADELSKQLDIIKIQNHELTEKILKLESQNDSTKCSQCQSKDEVISVKNKTSPRAKLNRSLSDSDTSSRNNKICTLQSEIYAGREDCKVLTEDVATIKQHLNCSNISMDLDDSMGDSNSFSQALDFTENIKCNMPDIQEEPLLDIYALDKVDCINYYLDITGLDRDHVSSDKKIIDIMKMLYNNLIKKHGNEVENLLNKLRDFEESQNKLQAHVNDMVFKYSNVKKTMEKNENDLNTVSKFISNIKSNVNRINDGLTSPKDKEALAEIINKFKSNFLNTLDFEFGVSSINIFEVIVDKYQDDLSSIEKHCITLQNKTENLNAELEVATENLAQLKTKLAENESAYNLLNAQKEKILEISNAVTLDIVRKEKEMLKVISENCQKLFELNLITADDLGMTEPAGNNINILFDLVISQHKKHEIQKKDEHKSLSIEVEKSKTMLDDKEKELAELKIQIQRLKDINNNVTVDLTDSENKLQKLKAAHDTLSKAYDNKSQENVNNISLIDQLTEEITSLKEKISHNEKVHAISSAELVNSITKIEEDNKYLKTMNQKILKEKEAFCQDLEKSTETIKSNIVEIKKMTADILELKDALENSKSTIDLLKQKAHTLTMENAEIKQSLDEKNQSYITLEKNIKTLEKTVEVQSAIIKRINKQKEEHDIAIAQKLAEINELTEKLSKSQNDCDELMKTKELLETRVTELQAAADKPRLSLDTSAEGSRRRRQSVHDCKRALEDLDEHKNLEAVFSSRQKPDDLFMDIDGEDTSGRSTPMGLGRGRDSLLSNTHQSDKDEEHSSRPSSVLATRRRRQSIHDMNRAVARHTPSPHDVSNRIIDDNNSFKDASGNRGDSSEMNQLREKLISCQQELEDLKERYRELDDECETCAEYLKEREEQCMRLKKEKAALEKQVNELKSCPNTSQQMQSKPGVSHVAVNTDEDWANLHAVVVDRMSYDAEVEKSKRLTKCIEELRFKQQDLKNTIAKMHMSLEKHSSKDVRELDATKAKLKAVQQELEELKVKYKELDEECETCSEYLKEREEQCRRLKDAKAALERKVEELQENGHAHALAHSQSVRKKRQTVHDSNREPIVDQADASTEISDDLASYQAEGDDSTHKATDTKRLKMTIQLLTNQKIALEKQLKTQAMPSAHPMYVATGSAIVQNQQLTDVIKENQKLKKINAKLVNYCKKRSKNDANRENEDPCEQG